VFLAQNVKERILEQLAFVTHIGPRLVIGEKESSRINAYCAPPA
jgi:hypothetical protein